MRDAARERASGGEGEGGRGSEKVSAAAAGLGQGLELPSDLLVSIRKRSCVSCVFLSFYYRVRFSPKSIYPAVTKYHVYEFSFFPE